MGGRDMMVSPLGTSQHEESEDSDSSSNGSPTHDDLDMDMDMDVQDNDDDDDDDDVVDEAPVTLPPPLYSTPTYFRQTRRGKILKFANELYLRDDLGLGFYVPPTAMNRTRSKSRTASKKQRAAAAATTGRACRIGTSAELTSLLIPSAVGTNKIRLVICDTNVLLHNLDVLEHPSCALCNVVIPQTALLECRKNSLSCYDRTVELLRSSFASSSSSFTLSTPGDDDTTQEKGSKSRHDNKKTETSGRQRLVVFFPDVHHVDTQVVPARRSRAPQSGKQNGANDVNDARIRRVAEYYAFQLRGSNTEVVLLTDDAQCRNLAIVEQQQHQQQEEEDEKGRGGEKKKKKKTKKMNSIMLYQPQSVRDYVHLLEKEDETLSLSDLVAQYQQPCISSYSAPAAAAHHGDGRADGTTITSAQPYYEPHLSASEISRGVKSGTYYQGIIRTERGTNWDRCYVTVRRGDERVVISIVGYQNVNRAVDGDVVAVELFSVDKWIGSVDTSKGLMNKREDDVERKRQQKEEEGQRKGTSGSSGGGGGGGAGIAQETAEPTLADVEGNVIESLPIPSKQRQRQSLERQETGTTKTSEDRGDGVDDDEEEDVTFRRPTGKIVGIIRRNFRRNYCGSIYSAGAGIGRRVAGSSSLMNDDEITNNHNEEDESAEMTDIEKNNGKKKKRVGDDVEGEPSKDRALTASASSSMQPPPKTKPTERDAIAAKFEVDHPTDGTTTCVFFPIDGRIPPVLVRTTQRERLLGHRILVAIDSWPSTSMYPLGHYVRTIGISGKKDVETEVLLHEHNVPCDPFPAKVLACLPPDDYKIDPANSPGRTDLRHLPVLSIDPPGCKDIDDALHCIVLPNGNYHVGVHIADVTHYVKPGTAIDLEAANRSTSTYLVNKRLDMLPGLLTTDLCSLKGNVDRYAFSVLWEVTPEADIVDVQFKKTIIHSIAALTYQQAQGLIDQPEDAGDIQAGAVKRLASLARKFRARRIAAGALTLASPEVKFVLDSESLNPTDVQAYALFEANALVEEFMLLANVTVAKKILRHYPTLSILRRHPAPNRAMFDSLISKARCRGFSIDIEDSKRLADSLDEAQIESDPYFNKLLRILSTRCMSPAQYFCSGEYRPTDWHHYGLAAPVYTHFTSPIRRYADVCAHRLLAAAIGVAPLPVHLSSKSYLHDLAANMNRRHRAAQLAGRASVQLHTLIFFSGENSGREEDAYVLDVEASENSEPSFTVIVPRYGIEGRVLLPHIDMNDKGLVREPEKHRIAYKDAKGNLLSSVQVFDRVRVRIWVKAVQENQKELVLDLVEPSFGSQVISEAKGRDSLGKRERESPKQSVAKTSKKKRREKR